MHPSRWHTANSGGMDKSLVISGPRGGSFGSFFPLGVFPASGRAAVLGRVKARSVSKTLRSTALTRPARDGRADGVGTPGLPY